MAMGHRRSDDLPPPDHRRDTVHGRPAGKHRGRTHLGMGGGDQRRQGRLCVLTRMTVAVRDLPGGGRPGPGSGHGPGEVHETAEDLGPVAGAP